MEERLNQLEQEIKKIQSRNASVELDKAWETSSLRRLLVAASTYLPIGIYMWAIGINRPWLNAIVPTLGFLISTLTLPWFKQMWISAKPKIKNQK